MSVSVPPTPPIMEIVAYLVVTVQSGIPPREMAKEVRRVAKEAQAKHEELMREVAKAAPKRQERRRDA